MPAPIAEIIVAAYGCTLVANVVREHIFSKCVSGSEPPTWEEIVRRLTYVKVPELRQVANSAEGDAFQFANANSSLLETVGGLEGLRRIQHNGIVLASLARRIEDFMVLNDSCLIETIKRSALRIRRKVLFVIALQGLGSNNYVVRILIRDVASLYCRMVSELIKLYETMHRSRVQRLIVACNWHST